jgi:hypothetical protein
MSAANLKPNDHVRLDDGTEGVILEIEERDVFLDGKNLGKCRWYLVGQRTEGGIELKDKWVQSFGIVEGKSPC